MKRIICATLAIILLLTASACGGKGTGKGTYLDAGHYDLFSMTRSSGTLSRENMDAMGWEVYLDLNEDGTGVLDMGAGDVIQLTWSDGSVTADGSTVSYTMAGGMLNLDLSDDDGPLVLVFQKSQPNATAEEAAAPAGEAETVEEPTPEPTAEPEVTPEPAGEPENTPEPTAEPEPETAEPSALPVVLETDQLKVEIISAEPFSDVDDKDAIRIYYDFTVDPDGKEAAEPWFVLSFTAEQAGQELDAAYAMLQDDVPEYGNDAHSVEPGVTVRCVQEFALVGSGPVTFVVSSDFTGEEVSAVFDPTDLPGRPSDEWKLAPLEDPQFFIDYPIAASTSGFDVEIVNAELTDSIIEGDPQVLRMFFQVTNNSTESAEPFWLMDLNAYQDGMSLSMGIPAEDSDSDALFYSEIPSGETVILSACWDLRTDNPVEVTVTDFFGSTGVVAAATLPIA